MTVSYGWSGLAMLLALLSRKATPAIVMALVIALLSLVHFGTFYLEKLVF